VFTLFKDNKKGGETIKTSALAAISVAVILSVAAVGVYFLFFNDGDDGTHFDDPMIQSNMGIGSKFTYGQVGDGKYDGNPATFTDFEAEIIGQSGSYYLLYVTYEYSYTAAGGGSGSGGNSFFVMTHKTTGELRFGSSAGTDSVEYDGKKISLKKWELKQEDKTSSSSSSGIYSFEHARIMEDTVTLSSGVLDAIPYKIDVTYANESKTKTSYSGGPPSESSHSESYSFSVELLSMVIEEPTEYIRSDAVGIGLAYKAEGTEKGYSVEGETAYFIAAEGEYEGFSFLCFAMYINVTSGPEKQFFVLYIPLTPDADGNYPKLSELVLNSYSLPIVEGELTERISTIDGMVDCYVIIIDTDSAKGKAWVGKDNGKLYLWETKIDTGSGKMTLIRNIG